MTSRPRWAETRLRYSFKDPSLLERALTHRSASKDNNERLEYLGDSFLSFAVARQLYERRPADAEGDLSRGRAALVKQSTLAAIGQDLGIDSIIILGQGELRSGGAQRSAILADAVEAVIGAVLLDGGPEAAEAVVALLFAQPFDELPDAAALKDAKTKLQELLQGHGLGLPVYKVDAVTGRDHEQTFDVVCEVEEKNVQTTGQGPSRRHAEQQAAAAMISVLAGELD
ncbi:MAG TPA: ribonuclease III [Gammaproteobacteria bacterium]|nr:ribonuclease III [Gammaproteobacteria bacterium]